MNKQVLTVPEVLRRIRIENSESARKPAVRLLKLATEVEAQLWPRNRGISVWLAGPPGGDPRWLTLFVVSTSGTLYANWLDRWIWAGIPKHAAESYRRDVEGVVGSEFFQHPSQYAKGVDLSEIHREWTAFRRLVRKAAAEIRTKGRARGMGQSWDIGAELAALEGQVVEARSIRRNRNGRLKKAAWASTKGVCACCRRNYSKVLGGDGVRVLEVHHVDQLAASDTPRLTTVDQLAVVCANCHHLIHADPQNAMPVDSMRAKWKRFRQVG